MNQNNLKQIGLGGGCHWCTEAVFASLKGVKKVEQGWIASTSPNDAFSEAVIVTYDPQIITLKNLIHIHLHTHASTSNHSMRHKYRSAVYWFYRTDKEDAEAAIASLQPDFDEPLVTQILPFVSFKTSVPDQLNYYYSNPEKPFCKVYINPKLQFLREQFSLFTNFKNNSSVKL
jgi:peptide-methionine (S)-S-oxide reductase